jgi:2-dehydro-3-deoxyphosphogluconate aldolase/(4S)-4-hydroxy-2-oxoglutarate aldolase
LFEGGLPVAEVTFRTDAAADSIRKIAAERPNVIVGAGTVLTTEQVAMAHDAGAQFLVTPGFNPKVVAEAVRRGIPIVPGANSPTDVEMGLEAGLDILKFFPAEASGGVTMLKSLVGPYGGVRFVPTGGIGAKNLAQYLALPNVLACGGSWMVDPKLIAQGNFDEITRLTREAISPRDR